MSRERRNNYQDRAEERQRQAERRARLAQERTERMARQAQERSERLARQSQERTERLNRQSQERAERLSRQAQERAERNARFAEERAKRASQARGYEEVRFETPYETKEGRIRRLLRSLFTPQDDEDFVSEHEQDGFDPLKDMFERMFEQYQETQATPSSGRESVNPAERTRRRLLQTLPRETAQTLAGCKESNVRNFIATVQKSREVNPERTDWNIYLTYRRAIERDNPDPDMVEKTQIAWLLIEDSRSENGRNDARFPF